MSRTPEQIAADEGLTAAIEQVMTARNMLADGEITLEYAVVAATQKMEADEIDNSYVLMLRDGRVASTRICGLLDVASFDIKMGDR